MTIPTNPEGVPDPAVAGLIEEARALLPELVGTLPACPFDRRSPDYWTTPNDKPCHVCGGTEEVDKCRGADLRCLDKADDIIRRLADELERVARQPGQERRREGFKLVPIEPTEAMKRTAWDLMGDAYSRSRVNLADTYRAMLATAPSPQPLIPEPPLTSAHPSNHHWDGERGLWASDMGPTKPPTEGVEFSKREGDETFTLSKEARDDPTLSYIINCAFFGRHGETLFNQLPEGGVRVTLDGYCVHPRDKPCPAQAVGVSAEEIEQEILNYVWARKDHTLAGVRAGAHAILKLLEAHHAG